MLCYFFIIKKKPKKYTKAYNLKYFKNRMVDSSSNHISWKYFIEWFSQWWIGGSYKSIGEENIKAIIMNPPLVPCIKHTHILLLIIISKYSIIKKKKTKLQVSSLCYHNHYHNYHNHYHNHKWRGCWATTHVSWHRLTFNSSLKNT